MQPNSVRYQKVSDAMFTRFIGAIVVLVLAAAFLPELITLFSMLMALIVTVFVLVMIVRSRRRGRSTTIHIHHR